MTGVTEDTTESRDDDASKPDDVGDAEEEFRDMLEQFLIDEGGSSIDDQDENWDTEDRFIESLEQFLIAEGDISNDGKDQFVNVADMVEKTNLNCANASMAGNLEVFYAKIRGGHWKTGEVVESKSMAYMIEGNIVLISRAVLEFLNCIPKQFLSVGEFLEPDDKALTGKSFAILRGKGMANEKAANDDDHEAVDKETESRKDIFPGHNAANAGKTGLDGKVGGTRSDPPEVVGEDNAGDVKTRPAVRQPVGECDPESELPCSCPRRTFVDPPEEMPMVAKASNRKALEEFIRKHCKTNAFYTCKRGSEMYSMIIKSGTVLMETCGDANNTEAIEEEFVSTEEDTIDAVGLVYMTTELCPTGGRENILRFEKSVVGKTTNADQRNGMTKPDDGGGDVCVQQGLEAGRLIEKIRSFFRNG